jgi:3-oxoacyl-[acyl-carrier protein] reductase
MTQKVALVTGASRGIGRGIAESLLAQGYIVAGTATTEQGAASITDYLQGKGAGYVLDVCDTDSVKQLHVAIVEQYAAPSVLVNNAGITQDNIFLRMKPEQWASVIDTNLNSVYRVSKVCLKAMLRQRWGRIINIASVVGVMGSPGQANYCAAKAGMIGFTKSLGQEMAAAGITVNAVAPGFIDTDMTRALTAEQREAINNQIPMKKIGNVEDIAAAVNFLASEHAGYITGQTLHVNGGMYMI